MKLFSCIALLAVFGSLGCDKGAATTYPSGTAPTAEVKPAGPSVSLQLNWKPDPEFGGFYAAQERGLFKKQNVDVEIVAGGVGTPTVQLIAAGKVPFGIVSADELIIARSRGSDIVAIFAAFQTDPHAIMVHASRGFKSLEDVLKSDSTLAIQRGYPYAMILEKRFGFNKVKVVPSPGGDVSAFLHDPNFAQQVFVFSEPLVAKKAGGDPQSFLIADVGYNPYTTVVATRRDYLRDHREIVKGFALACRDGWTGYLDDPKPINAVIGKLNPSMDDATLEQATAALTPLARNAETATIGIGGMTADRWKTLNQQLVDLKLVDKAQPAEDCFIPVEQLGAK